MKTIFPLKPHYLRLAYVMQLAVFHAYRYHDISGAVEGKKRLVDYLRREFSAHSVKYEVQFDESLWPPTEPGETSAHMAIMRIKLAPFPTPQFWILELDFRKDMFNGVSLVNETGTHPFNVFDVRYEAP